jgi:hypothetical protein
MLKAERVTFIQHRFFCSLNEDTNMSVALFILDSIPRLKISSSEHSLTNISVIRERRPIPLTIVASYVSSKRSNSSFSVDILFFFIFVHFIYVFTQDPTLWIATSVFLRKIICACCTAKYIFKIPEWRSGSSML